MDIGGLLVWLTKILISIISLGRVNIEADALSRIKWEKCDETIQVELIQAVVTSAIAGDLVNIEAVSCSMQTVEPFLPMQSEQMPISKLSHGLPIRVI